MLFKSGYGVFVILASILQKVLILFSRDFALNCVVADSDKLSIEDLLIDQILVLTKNYFIFKHDTDGQTNDRRSQSKRVLKMQHFLILLASYLQKDELLVILLCCGCAKQ